MIIEIFRMLTIGYFVLFSGSTFFDGTTHLVTKNNPGNIEKYMEAGARFFVSNIFITLMLIILYIDFLIDYNFSNRLIMSGMVSLLIYFILDMIGIYWAMKGDRFKKTPNFERGKKRLKIKLIISIVLFVVCLLL